MGDGHRLPQNAELSLRAADLTGEGASEEKSLAGASLLRVFDF
jgi:hypothetical protein